MQSGGLVGREAELEQVLEVLDARAEGDARLVLQGEAGIGKTTIWQAAVDEARRRGIRTLEARPASAEHELAFAALGDLLAGVPDEIGGLPAPQRRALRIALLLEDASGRSPEARTIAVALTALLRLLSFERLVLVAIDDAHWLDPQSAAALEFALRRLDGTSVRLVATARTGSDTALLEADARRVLVGPLEFDALAALLRERFDVGFRRPVLRRLDEASGGNPFYAIELATALLQSGRGATSSRVNCHRSRHTFAISSTGASCRCRARLATQHSRPRPWHDRGCRSSSGRSLSECRPWRRLWQSG